MRRITAVFCVAMLAVVVGMGLFWLPDASRRKAREDIAMNGAPVVAPVHNTNGPPVSFEGIRPSDGSVQDDRRETYEKRQRIVNADARRDRQAYQNALQVQRDLTTYLWMAAGLLLILFLAVTTLIVNRRRA